MLKLKTSKEVKGINFIYDDNNINGRLLCEIEVKAKYNNLNYDHYNFEFINQLKEKKYISKNIWTFDYLSLSEGIINFGGELHKYEGDKSHSFKYKTIYVDLKDNKNDNNSLNFHFDKISINESDYILKDTKAEILIENGLNIDPEEYKNLIEKNFF